MTGPNKRPILDVLDARQTFTGMQGDFAKLHDMLIGLSIQHTNMITGFGKSPQTDQFFLLRDCIMYRRSILFLHLDMLITIREHHLAQLAETSPNSAERSMILYNGGEQQFGVFDSVAFHSISLFDYLANLVAFICTQKHEANLKWTGVVSACRDRANPLSQSPVAPAVLEYASSFVDRLYDHRSHLIHYSNDLGAAIVSFDPMTGKSDFKVFAPHRFLHSQHHLRGLSKENDITLFYVAFWVVRNTLDAACKIVEAIFKHIEEHRVIPPGKEFFIFRPPPKDGLAKID